MSFHPSLPAVDSFHCSQNASGWLRIVGLGPGSADMLTPEALHALRSASDIVGYQPYVTFAERLRVGGAGVGQSVAGACSRAQSAAPRGLPPAVLHPSDNREEIARAQWALTLAAQGRRVAVVSSGDPGVFAMASAVFEAMESAMGSGSPHAWQMLDVQVLPGITAMLAAAARLGAPLGHDFCCINLSDNLKPWAVIAQRVELALRADFAIAIYNPSSRSRSAGFDRLLQLLRRHCSPNRLLSFARAVGTDAQSLHTCELHAAHAALADMRTLVIIHSSHTRRVGRWVYAPRHYEGTGGGA